MVRQSLHDGYYADAGLDVEFQEGLPNSTPVTEVLEGRTFTGTLFLLPRIRHRRTRKFVEATTKGWEYALKHPVEILDLIPKKDSKKSPREKLIFEARGTRAMIQPDIYPVGSIDEGRVRRIAVKMVELGMVEKGYDPSGFIYGLTARSPGAATHMYFSLEP